MNDELNRLNAFIARQLSLPLPLRESIAADNETEEEWYDRQIPTDHSQALEQFIRKSI